MDGRLNEFGFCWIAELDVLIKSREEALKREMKLEKEENYCAQ